MKEIKVFFGVVSVKNKEFKSSADFKRGHGTSFYEIMNLTKTQTFIVVLLLIIVVIPPLLAVLTCVSPFVMFGYMYHRYCEYRNGLDRRRANHDLVMKGKIKR